MSSAFAAAAGTASFVARRTAGDSVVPARASGRQAQRRALSLGSAAVVPSVRHAVSARASTDDKRGAEGESERPLADASAPELSSFLQLLQERRAAAAAAEAGPQQEAGGPGCVYLVGTGPGDPGLLTLNALRLMQTADVVLHDRLVSDDILGLVNMNARMVYVGKQSGFHTRTQDEIHKLLEEFAGAGARVIRLKGGDPLIFGRGGEEFEYLSQRGIAVHVVPGITAAVGIAAELGIPLTHRGVATSVRFITGHSREGGEDPADIVAGAADANTTLVVYMGLATLPALTESLVAHGLSASTPAVAVERGTTSRQRRVFASLGDLHLATRAESLKSPTLVVIGNCVALSPLWPVAALALADEGTDQGAEGQQRAQPWVLQAGSVGSGVYLESISGGLPTDAAVREAAAPALEKKSRVGDASSR